MRPIELGQDEIIQAAFSAAESTNISILDSCGVGHLGSRLLIAGLEPVEVIELGRFELEPIKKLEKLLTVSGLAAVFTLSYEIGSQPDETAHRTITAAEPTVFVAFYKNLLVHDYVSRESFVTGPGAADAALPTAENKTVPINATFQAPRVKSNFTKAGYLEAIGSIQEAIKSGITYQTNLTQQLTVDFDPRLTPEIIFARLRENHPAPFAAYLKRLDSTVVSASPERFLKINGRRISASPIKGTKRRGKDKEEDDLMRNELLSSQKDRAENTMIVDLLRNDMGRVCDFGSVAVEKLCELEEHPTLFHLVSTITGRLRDKVGIGDVIPATFPCGSITGAPKISTMEIIAEMEPNERGLSMGAIGICIPEQGFEGLEAGIEMSVAIRTMVIRDRTAVFNVGGGIVIDSDPEMEYNESLLKAKALLSAIGIDEVPIFD